MATLAERLGREPGSMLDTARRLEAAGWVEPAPMSAATPAHSNPGRSAADEMAPEQTAALRHRDLPPGGELLLQGVAASGKTTPAGCRSAARRNGGDLPPEITGVPQIADRLRAAVGPSPRSSIPGSRSGSGTTNGNGWWTVTPAWSSAPARSSLRLALLGPPRAGRVPRRRVQGGPHPRYDTRWVAARRAVLTGAGSCRRPPASDVVTIHRVRADLLDVPGSRNDESARCRPARGSTCAPSWRRATGRSCPARSPAPSSRSAGEQAILLINRRGRHHPVPRLRRAELFRPALPLAPHHPPPLSLPPRRPPPIPIGVRAAAARGSATSGRAPAGWRRRSVRFPRLRVGRLDSRRRGGRRRFESIYDDFSSGLIRRAGRDPARGQGAWTCRPSPWPRWSPRTSRSTCPRYQAAERTFQLLAQVAGRAGRGPRPGLVLIQTYAPDHPAVVAASRLDVDAFADGELPRRQAFGYPPFGWLARLLVADPDPNGRNLAPPTPPSPLPAREWEVLGPVPGRGWRAGRWRWQVVVRAASEATRAAAMERVPPGIGIDVDPGTRLTVLQCGHGHPSHPDRRRAILHRRAKKVNTSTVPPSAPRRPARDDAGCPGIGLAANQVGVPLQVAVIEIEGKITELVNPKVVRRSGKTVDWEDACRSRASWPRWSARRRSLSRPATGMAASSGSR